MGSNKPELISPPSGEQRRRRLLSMDARRHPDKGETPESLLLGSPVLPFGSFDLEHDGLGSPKEPSPSLKDWRSCLIKEPLLLLTLAGVIAGILCGGLLRLAHLDPAVITLIGFPGELMLRLLKMLVLPLVAMSMVSGMCAMRESGSTQSVARLARLTAAYYVGSTLLAIALGIVLVLVIQPGRGAAFDKVAAAGGCHAAEADKVAQHAQHAKGEGSVDALLQVARLVVPDNLVGAAADMNVLGIITFSLLLGWALSSLGPRAAEVVAAVHVLNAAVGKMVTAALWVSPLGVASLISAALLKACDLGGTLSALALWMATVVLGLSIYAFMVLPALLLLFTRRSPLQVASKFGQALLLAFGTSSSAASLPLAMAGAREAGCSEAVTAFFLPMGLTINLTGTAIYEATTAIFIAQAHGVPLGLAGVLVVAFTASLAAVGAPAIPSAGLVTMLVVLQAVGLDQYSGDLATVLAADWLLDRLRTAVNLLGDAYGCVIVDHLLKQRALPLGGGGGGGSYVQLELSARGGGGDMA